MIASNDIKTQLIERAGEVKSAKVKKYVHDAMIRKIDQAGDAAGAWLERLEYDFKKLKPEGLMKGFEQEDFDDLWYVITGEKSGKRASLDRIAGRIVEALIVKKAPAGMLNVQLMSVSDPDRDDAGEKRIPQRWVVVRSMAEAVTVVRAFITQNDLGMGNWTGGKIVDEFGMIVAQITFNGRVWEPGKFPQPEINVHEFDQSRIVKL